MEFDRRKYPRIENDQVISFSLVDAPEQLALGRDVSVGGIRFEVVGCEIDLGEVLRLTFNVDGETVVATGRVAWSTDLDAVTQDVGIEFVEVEPRVAELLAELAEKPEN